MFDSVLKCLHFTLFDGVTKFEKFPKWEISERSLPGDRKENPDRWSALLAEIAQFRLFWNDNKHHTN